MALFPAPILTDGATHSAQQFRMLVRDLARGAEGITQGTDLKVTQLSTPGTSVQVGDGSGVVRGRVNPFQGHYSVCNIGAVSVPIAATGGSPRSDMVILRVEDQEYEGSVDPVTGQVAYFQVISNVSSSATTIPDGRTGIPLARIDIPASTSTITDAYIKDIRKIANPRRERSIYTASPTALSNIVSNTNSVFTNFNTATGWQVPIPTWATQVKIRFDVGQLRYTSGDFLGSFRAILGLSLSLQAVSLDDNQGGTGTRRASVISGDTLTLPGTYPGTTQTLRAQATGRAGNAGSAAVDTATTLVADVEFIETPV